MRNENLRWRKGLVAEIVTKAEGNCLLSQSKRILNFGSGSTVFMQASLSIMGLDYTLSHTSTRVSTSTKLTARKVRGGRVRGMLVLAHMNTTKWQRMNSQQSLFQNIRYTPIHQYSYKRECSGFGIL